MKVIYEKTICEKVQAAQHEADGLGKTIEKIILTEAEWCQLSREVEGCLLLRPEPPLFSQRVARLYGVRIVRGDT